MERRHRNVISNLVFSVVPQRLLYEATKLGYKDKQSSTCQFPA